MRKTFVVGLIIIFIISLAESVLAYSPQGFKDFEDWYVKGGQFYWAREYVNNAIRFDFMMGYPLDENTKWRMDLSRSWHPEPQTIITYEPPYMRLGNTITRAEFATMLSRMLGLDDKQTTGQPFADVRPEDWFYKYIGQLVDYSVILPGDYKDGTLKPNDPITRVEIAVWVSRAAQKEGIKPKDGAVAFMDVDDKNHYYFGIRDAVKLGIITGYDDGTFRPFEKANRAEAAAMIMRLFDQLPNDESIKDSDLIQVVKDFYRVSVEVWKNDLDFLPNYKKYGFDKYVPPIQLIPIAEQRRDGPPVLNEEGLGVIAGGGPTFATGQIMTRSMDGNSWYAEMDRFGGRVLRKTKTTASVRFTLRTHPLSRPGGVIPVGDNRVVIVETVDLRKLDGKWVVTNMRDFRKGTDEGIPTE